MPRRPRDGGDGAVVPTPVVGQLGGAQQLRIVHVAGGMAPLAARVGRAVQQIKFAGAEYARRPLQGGQFFA